MKQSELYRLYEAEPEPVVSFLQYLREAYGLPEPARILDMGCGPGRMLRPLAEAGWVVTGYEPDPDYLRAAERVAEEVSGVSVRPGGLLDLDAHEAFDLIALVNGPYSYLLDPAERRDAIGRCARALAPGGVLFIEVANFPWILANYREPPRLELDVEGATVVRTARHDIDFHDGLFVHHDRFEWTDADGEARSVEKTHAMAAVSFPEIRHFLLDAGFEDIRTFDSLTARTPARLDGRKIVVAARRPHDRTSARAERCIVIVTVDAPAELIPRLAEHARLGIRRFPEWEGYLGGALHLSQDGTRLVQYLSWASETDYRRCIEDPEWDSLPSTREFAETVRSGNAVVDARVFAVAEAS